MRSAACLALVGALLLAGCYGSTEPATDVTPDSAVLHARGTANDGPASTYFEVEELWFPFREPLRTPTRNWPAGASGPFSEKVTGLREAFEYHYRLCGNDAGEEPVCANRRFFSTRGPNGVDSVIGFWSSARAAPDEGGLRAIRDPDGSNPRGHLSITIFADIPTRLHEFKGFVTCFRIEGRQATVGAKGLNRIDGQDEPATAIASFSDGGPGADQVGRRIMPGSTPPDCNEDLELFGGGVRSIVLTDN